MPDEHFSQMLHLQGTSLCLPSQMLQASDTVLDAGKDENPRKPLDPKGTMLAKALPFWTENPSRTGVWP